MLSSGNSQAEELWVNAQSLQTSLVYTQRYPDWADTPPSHLLHPHQANSGNRPALKTVLVLEPDRAAREIILGTLAQQQLQAVVVPDAAAALRQAKISAPDVIRYSLCSCLTLISSNCCSKFARIQIWRQRRLFS